METVQAGAHTAVLAYALAAAEVPDRFHTPVSAGLAELVDGVAGGESRVYADIQAAFDGADDVAAAARELADADHDEFRRLYEGV
jgi:prephenate dehydrogenase